MSQTTSRTETGLPGASERVEIHPFHIDVPEEEFAELRPALRRRGGPKVRPSRRVTGRAARDDAGACALLGHRVMTSGGSRRG
jgi:hypothetical protein